jgi:hypothetical protein
MFFVLKFELISIIGSNNVLTEGARKVYRGRLGARGRRVGQGCPRVTLTFLTSAFDVSLFTKVTLRNLQRSLPLTFTLFTEIYMGTSFHAHASTYI